ncbi:MULTISPECIES: glyceraldehyde-3-phosphate dehydrogenase [Psychrobacter]|uniref:glyceraldehyde-3-phosphate dehydrogenase n=1 Tax=Psychrobacter TaxID=497 RepID=UPI00086A782A|nr:MULTISPECIES: glyceraldehyde-3-phosphate dehydrogenase [Psychrobacter]MBA6243869.1 glyceraldehyde-3-phosphate dehydrogenase [Psychrobacter sp. Urea-trap-18]MBA6285452.1 glyceraldehyde-3-phosphate dehydrogenase [Psychrobacter sp. Urea-trap-16]MBA6319028.1 glyceraldehyde-3-phosphate dehydrogenase [Psychrobacter sp. Urea-trap-20]MBA6335047.1 glyceraldehyde-3-phosphate dehydrogenase [Psychrobacter sp. Urea-trap-19]OEH69253.1 MAG: glyceraldehyde-3-phosphate dehydrogenase [Psychrobacter sp. B29-1|tara:strand:+ start:6656 stop:8098 length:1443 start_codon:yes stop_codon:yes gene_type:complete
MFLVSNADTLRQLHQDHLNNYNNQEQQAIELIRLLNKLYNKQDVQVTLFGETLDSTSVGQILALHQKVALRDHSAKAIDIADTLSMVKVISENTDIQATRIDVGQLIANDTDLQTALQSINNAGAVNGATDVVLYGFGRIGRILTRLLLSQASSAKGLQLKAIVVRPAAAGDLAKRISLLERDSIHGRFLGGISIDDDNNGMIVNGRFVQVIYAKDPSEIDYTAYGIDNALVIDNTGIWKDEAGLGKHLQSTGVKKVLLTAPAGGDIKNVVYGVNNDTVGDDTIVSAASCTTNAITPTLNVLNDEYGIVNGHVETIHSFTNDQNLVDNYHKADRRGRSAVMNMVITSTGAAKAVGKALPELNGKLTGNAIRVPTPNVSLAILNVNLKTAPASADALNEFLRKMANSSTWQSQIAYTDSTEAVSTDFVGTTHVGIIDAQATILTDNQAIVYVWYDNEVGYSTQVLRLATQMAGISYAQIPA